MEYTQFLLLILLAKDVLGKNILIIDGVPSPSHQIFHNSIADALVSRGYNVTVLRANIFPVKKRENVHTILLEEINESMLQYLEDLNWVKNLGPYSMLQIISGSAAFYCNTLLGSRGVQTLINYPKDFKFDAILIDLDNGPCMFTMIYRFNYPPAIATTPFLLAPYYSEMFGNDIQPSYLPIRWVDFSENMNFWERLQNYFWTRLWSYKYSNFGENLIQIAKHKFGEEMPSLETLRDHISLLLCNIVPGFHYPQPLTPNIIPVGGLHIKPAKALPKDLQEIVDYANNGFILFSLGSSIRSDKISISTRNELLKAFSKLNQTVLWKFESEIDDLPKNVIIRKWLPQNDLFAHPNMKFFISHGGGHSIIEALHYGVPVLGIPFYADQRNNIDIIVDREMGIKVDYLTITESSFLESMNEMLLNTKYSKNMKKLSEQLRDRLHSPIDQAVFWIEYSIRHNGTHFLGPKSRELSIFVSSSTDVILLLVLVIGILFIVLYKIILRIFTMKCEKLKSKNS